MESQGDSPNKIGLVGSARCDGGGAFVFCRYFSCSFVSARGYLLLIWAAGGSILQLLKVSGGGKSRFCASEIGSFPI